MDYQDIDVDWGFTSRITPSPLVLEQILDHVQTLQSQLDEVNEQLQHLQRQDARLQRGLQQLDNQVERARQLQHDLLPRALPECDSLRISALYLPASELSGDMYDVVRLNDHQLAINISDATGHGMAAAMLNIFAKQAMRVRESQSGELAPSYPNDVLQKLNHELVQADLSECDFITSIQAIYDEVDECVIWSRGGMPYPILISPGRRPQYLISEGGLVGAVAGQHYDLVSTHLHVGDLLLFYSDGLEALLLNRATNGRAATLLDTPWCQTLSTASLPEHLTEIEDRVHRAPPGSWHLDDITMLALHRPAC